MALRDLCERYNIRFKKALGQNLLLDDNINRIMVEAAALTAEDDVVEVGAGLGALTGRLCAAAGRVLAVEIDPAFMPCLEDQFGAMDNVRLFRGDILNHELRKLLDEHLPGCTVYKLVSNLPYYITTPILFHFWEAAVPYSRMVVMVQEEVAMRMTAGPGGPDYGVLTLAAQYHGSVDVVHRVPRTCFRPQPRVDSCIVRLRARPSVLYPDVDPAFLFRVIRAAFSQRRKTLRNALTRSGFGAPKEAVLDAFDAAGVDPGCRAQTLVLDDFARLAQAIKTRC
ncbi:MAG: 16S rRNA (adenine(1518)-N(6)/adenine(1519)-N(6))-dimethyltransferase RsmA [Candidatus Hydrogenedentes bacterium]|nr:16S rRNA (adenine(1518)-N(6)/adenine(1519)-N(6))-dimethyltransferase RsmA [Candidatus Hydrogenedentota bacterium]